jgi:gamma-glutamyltranspeptidase
MQCLIQRYIFRFGSRRVSQATGIIMNNEMDDFATDTEKPNLFGIPPSFANRIAPGKIPQSSMSPTVVVDNNGDVRMVIGGAGGSRIISSVTNVITICRILIRLFKFSYVNENFIGHLPSSVLGAKH